MDRISTPRSCTDLNVGGFDPELPGVAGLANGLVAKTEVQTDVANQREWTVGCMPYLRVASF